MTDIEAIRRDRARVREALAEILDEELPKGGRAVLDLLDAAYAATPYPVSVIEIARRIGRGEPWFRDPAFVDLLRESDDQAGAL